MSHTPDDDLGGEKIRKSKSTNWLKDIRAKARVNRLAAKRARQRRTRRERDKPDG